MTVFSFLLAIMGLGILAVLALWWTMWRFENEDDGREE